MTSKPLQDDARGAARFPEPGLIDRHDVPLVGLPAALRGLRVLHLTDLHARRYRPRYRVLIEQLERLSAAQPPHFVMLTGDWMTRSPDERVALRVLRDVLGAVRPTVGCVGVFGNHDPMPFRKMVREATDVEWLHAGVRDYEIERNESRCTLRVLGCSDPEDWLSAVRADHEAGEPSGEVYRLALAHNPASIAALVSMDVRVGLMLAGHTHGGQIRFGFGPVTEHHWAGHTSTDLPRHKASGLLQLGRTRLAIARGIGEQIVDVRWNCDPHAPLYRLVDEPDVHEDVSEPTLARVLHW